MGKETTVATTFNMSVALKERVQIYIATKNRTTKEKKEQKQKINLGVLLNKALTEYLDKVGNE